MADIVINIGGFVSFGFMLSVWLAWFTRFKLSLTIEALPVFLPTRNSDLTDVLTNTFGAWLGVMLRRSWLRRLLWFRRSGHTIASRFATGSSACPTMGKDGARVDLQRTREDIGTTRLQSLEGEGVSALLQKTGLA